MSCSKTSPSYGTGSDGVEATECCRGIQEQIGHYQLVLHQPCIGRLYDPFKVKLNKSLDDAGHRTNVVDFLPAKLSRRTEQPSVDDNEMKHLIRDHLLQLSDKIKQSKEHTSQESEHKPTSFNVDTNGPTSKLEHTKISVNAANEQINEPIFRRYTEKRIESTKTVRFESPQNINNDQFTKREIEKNHSKDTSHETGDNVVTDWTSGKKVDDLCSGRQETNSRKPRATIHTIPIRQTQDYLRPGLANEELISTS